MGIIVFCNAHQVAESFTPLAGGVKNLSYDTKNDTNSAKAPIPSLQVIEKNGGDDGTRTRGLCRDRAAF
jgi:hypothetical protein